MKETLLLGTYTRKTSEGIYTIELNKETKTLENLALVIKTENPTYLEYHKDTNTLYSVYQKGDRGGVACIDYDQTTATLKETVTQEGAPPCYVHFDARRNELYDSNYHGGFVNVYKDGQITKTFKYDDGARAHYVNTHPKTGNLYTVDLGNDHVHKYHDLKLVDTYTSEKGMGPRHLVFHPTAPITYVFTELSCDLIVLKDEDKFEEIQTISTVPEGAEKSGAAIRISKDGKFVYVSNRGHDSITVFKVLEDYTLEQVQNISTFGEHPRDFNLSHDDQFLVCANRDTNNLVLYERNEESGILTLLSDDTQADEVVNIIFI